MAKLLVLDPSLTCLGGHYYELAVRILQAADRCGYEPVLGTHRRFRHGELLPRHWRVLPVFADDSFGYDPGYPVDLAGRSLSASSLPARGGWAGLDLRHGIRAAWRWWRGRERRRRLERLAAACQAVDAAVGLRAGDQVFLPSTSFFDLLGVARFLAAVPDLAGVTWHGLFHRGFLQGREPEYAAQASVERTMRRQLEYLVQHIPPGRLRLYGTSQKLADQFNRLAQLEFRVLPFPVDLQTLPDDASGAPQRLRLMCAGFLRREKGKAVARQFVEEIWDQELASGGMQLVVQTNRRQARRMIAPRMGVPLVFRSSLQRDDTASIVWLRHPLVHEAYLNLIRQADIAVFLHDGRAYYTQCSGVLVEMLAGGVPVLVPAGSWLSDQVAEPNYEHLDALRAAASMRALQPLDAAAWHLCVPAGRGGAGPVFGNAAAAAACEVEVVREARAALVSFTWDPATPPGTYIRVAVQPAGPVVDATTRATVAILGPRALGKPVSTFVALDGGTERVRLSLSNAYDDAWVSVRHAEICLLGAPASGAASYPAGQVGLAYADVHQLPLLVRNLREHYPHYRASARLFAATWRHRHDAQRIVEQLAAGAAVERRAVA